MLLFMSMWIWQAAGQDVYPEGGYPDRELMKAYYPFVHLENNRLVMPARTDRNFVRFMKRLEQGQGKLRIYHFGGSHIQGGIWPQDLRLAFRRYFDSLPGERGWIFPFNLAHTNNPFDYRMESGANWNAYRSSWQRAGRIPYTYGLSGYIITTADTVVDMRFRQRDSSHHFVITRLVILHNRGEVPYDLELVSPPSLRTTIKDLDQGVTTLSWEQPVDSFHIRWTRKPDAGTDDSLHIYGFILENDLPGISYSGIGVNGAGTYTYLEAGYFERDLALYPPDLAIISLGTNDANIPYKKFKPEVFRRRLEHFIEKIKKTNPQAAIVLTVPNDAYYRRRYPNANVARVRRIILETGRRYGYPVWDLYAIMGGRGSSRTWMKNGLMKRDLIHFTREGYHLISDLLFQAILTSIPENERKLP